MHSLLNKYVMFPNSSFLHNFMCNSDRSFLMKATYVQMMWFTFLGLTNLRFSIDPFIIHPSVWEYLNNCMLPFGISCILKGENPGCKMLLRFIQIAVGQDLFFPSGRIMCTLSSYPILIQMRLYLETTIITTVETTTIITTISTILKF